MSPRSAVIIPAGPKDDVVDSLDSVLTYLAPPRLVVIVDDTSTPAVRRAASGHPDVEVIAADPSAPGGYGGLWVKLCQGFRRVLQCGPWDVVLRMDADALVTGAGLESIARARFDADPTLGVLGAYRTGPTGGTRDWAPAARILRAEGGLAGWRHPGLRRTLRRLSAVAVAQGYEPGAHALGGAYVLSPRLLSAWSERGWLDLRVLCNSRLGEDHICGLFAAAAGYSIGDMSGPDDCMAVSWRGLADSPDALLRNRKLVVHSVRSHGAMNEAAIRDQFRRARQRSDRAWEGAL